MKLAKPNVWKSTHVFNNIRVEELFNSDQSSNQVCE